jgi:hypothetical protein
MPATLARHKVRKAAIGDQSRRAFTTDEAWRLFDDTARQYMRMSGAEFLRAWDDGDFRGETSEAHRAVRVAILIPSVRKTSARKKPR